MAWFRDGRSSTYSAIRLRRTYCAFQKKIAQLCLGNALSNRCIFQRCLNYVQYVTSVKALVLKRDMSPNVFLLIIRVASIINNLCLQCFNGTRFDEVSNKRQCSDSIPKILNVIFIIVSDGPHQWSSLNTGVMLSCLRVLWSTCFTSLKQDLISISNVTRDGPRGTEIEFRFTRFANGR